MPWTSLRLSSCPAPAERPKPPFQNLGCGPQLYHKLWVSRPAGLCPGRQNHLPVLRKQKQSWWREGRAHGVPAPVTLPRRLQIPRANAARMGQRSQGLEPLPGREGRERCPPSSSLTWLPGGQVRGRRVRPLQEAATAAGSRLPVRTFVCGAADSASTRFVANVPAQGPKGVGGGWGRGRSVVSGACAPAPRPLGAARRPEREWRGR